MSLSRDVETFPSLSVQSPPPPQRQQPPAAPPSASSEDESTSTDADDDDELVDDFLAEEASEARPESPPSGGARALSEGASRAGTTRSLSSDERSRLTGTANPPILRSESSTAEPEWLVMLRSVFVSANLPLHLQELFLSCLHPASFDTGAYIVTQGEMGDAFFIIEDGTVSVEDGGLREPGARWDAHPPAPPRVLAQLYPGAHFGEVSLLRQQPRNASVVAREGPVRVLALTRDDFSKLVDEHPSLKAVIDAFVQETETTRNKREAARRAGADRATRVQFVSSTDNNAVITRRVQRGKLGPTSSAVVASLRLGGFVGLVPSVPASPASGAGPASIRPTQSRESVVVGSPRLLSKHSGEGVSDEAPSPAPGGDAEGRGSRGGVSAADGSSGSGSGHGSAGISGGGTHGMAGGSSGGTGSGVTAGDTSSGTASGTAGGSAVGTAGGTAGGTLGTAGDGSFSPPASTHTTLQPVRTLPPMDASDGDSSIAPTISTQRLNTLNNYVIMRSLGMGTYGRVYYALDVDDLRRSQRTGVAPERDFAIKIVDQAKLRRRRLGKISDAEMLREVQVMQRLKHVNLVTLKEVLVDTANSTLAMVQEYCEYGPIMSDAEFNTPLQPELARGCALRREGVEPMKRACPPLPSTFSA